MRPPLVTVGARGTDSATEYATDYAHLIGQIDHGHGDREFRAVFALYPPQSTDP
jgi:hypothetical protein